LQPYFYIGIQILNSKVLKVVLTLDQQVYLISKKVFIRMAYTNVIYYIKYFIISLCVLSGNCEFCRN